MADYAHLRGVFVGGEIGRIKGRGFPRRMCAELNAQGENQYTLDVMKPVRAAVKAKVVA